MGSFSDTLERRPRHHRVSTSGGEPILARGMVASSRTVSGEGRTRRGSQLVRLRLAFLTFHHHTVLGPTCSLPSLAGLSTEVA
jgi:hypothetical protein